MPWNGSGAFDFNELSVVTNASTESGVYALFNEGHWIYIGESENIRARLIQHLRNEENPCVRRNNPRLFAYLPVPALQRVRVQDALILELRPSCNMRLG